MKLILLISNWNIYMYKIRNEDRPIHVDIKVMI